MKSHNIFALIFLLLTFIKGAEAQPLCSYNAKISDVDKKNSAGASLTAAGANKASLAAIIRQDRANFHQFKVRDAEDEADCIFSDKQMRSKIESMISSSSFDPKVIENIVASNPLITVTVYGDKLSISLAGASIPKSEKIDLKTDKKSPPTASSKSLTGPQKNAVRASKQYLSFKGFSRDGLIDQLSSQFGNGFEEADAIVAVDSMNVDWNEQAAKSAKAYLDMMGFSCSGLIKQLSSSAGDKFTESEASFGARKAGAC